MKVILLEDDVRLGDKGSIVEVKNGFAVNFLIPRKKAAICSKSAESIVRNNLKQQQKKIEKTKNSYKEQADRIKALKLEFTAKAALTGHIYGTITNQQVADEIKRISGIEVDKKKIMLNTHIKTEGSYSAHIKLFSGVNVVVPLIVKVEKEVIIKEDDKPKKRRISKVDVLEKQDASGKKEVKNNLETNEEAEEEN